MSTTQVRPSDVRRVVPVRIGTVQPRGGPLGPLSELQRDPLGLLTRCARDYGDFVRLRAGPLRVVLISHPELIEEMLIARQHDFRKDLDARRLRSVLGNGLLVSEGADWLRVRRLMQPAFHRQQIDGLAHAMVSTTMDVLSRWQSGQQCDIYPEMMDIALRIVAGALFGTDITAALPRVRRASTIVTEHLSSRMFSLLMLLPDSVPTPGNLRYAAAVRELGNLAYELIAQRRASSSGVHTDLLGLLFAAKDEAGHPLTDQQLRDEIFTIMSAGYDTTALALTWTWVLLAQHPAAAARLRADVDAALADRAPTAADVPRLRSVEHVLAETLRLYPPAWPIAREALRDTQIGGQPVRKGTTVLLSPWIVQRDSRFFDDAEAFRPERWAGGLAEHLPRFAYFPFGGGQRVCIGSPFAKLELTLVLTTILQRFKIELVDPARSIVPLPVLTLQPRGGVPVTLLAR